MSYKINMHGKKVRRGYLVNESTSKVIYFQYNPTEIIREVGSVYSTVDSQGSAYPEVNYIRGEKQIIPLTLELDGVGRNFDCEAVIKQLEALTKPTGNKLVTAGGKSFREPPRCTFVWGDEAIKCVVVKVKTKGKQFDRQLNTTVATVELELLKYVD